jgi:predicted ribosomally synthesized peptide with nif11-like leader
MSVESAVAYITRMRDDRDFHQSVNALAEDEEASWAFVKESGYEFTMSEFKEAQDAVYKERGITPM